jgi:very-short-patch-repair endonuclease
MARRKQSAARRTFLRRRVSELADEQAGIVSRRQLKQLGVQRWQVRAEVNAGRWALVGRQAICVHCGPLSDEAMRWVAVLEAGPRAFLDGASALAAAGLTGFVTPSIRVSVPRGARIYRRVDGVDIRQTRRWQSDDLAAGKLPRSRPAVAAVRGALWARSDRQAALLLTMVVQQGLATAQMLAEELLRIKRDKRRALVQGVVLDLLGGVRSLGELDVVRECRRRGLPEPSKQVLRRGRNGKYYLDLCWEQWSVVVEVDGIQHAWAEHLVDDAVRHNDISIQSATVLRLPLLGLRVDPDTFFGQITEALVANGWTPPAAA